MSADKLLVAQSIHELKLAKQRTDALLRDCGKWWTALLALRGESVALVERVHSELAEYSLAVGGWFFRDLQVPSIEGPAFVALAVACL